MILTIDNFLGNSLNNYVQWNIQKQHYINHSSNINDPAHFLATPGTAPRGKLYDYIGNIIIDIQEINVSRILRSYVNLNPPGDFCAGKYHTDDGDITALYFPCDWQNPQEGGTNFKDKTTIEYVRDRLVLFNADYLHKAEPHYGNSFRYTIAYKLEATWNIVNENSTDYRYAFRSA